LRWRNWPIWLPITREASSSRRSGSRTAGLENEKTPIVRPSATAAKAKPPRSPVPSQRLR
jgi:hypothetical protein